MQGFLPTVKISAPQKFLGPSYLAKHAGLFIWLKKKGPRESSGENSEQKKSIPKLLFRQGQAG